MKKSVIALAVASAMPFAAQADTTITGSVSAKYVVSTSDAKLIDKGLDVDSDLDVSSTEVLANGMTATASFDVGSEGDSGKAGLSGDFGTVTVGSALDADGAFQAGDIAGVVGDTTTGDSDEDGAEANAINYSGSFSGLNLSIQLNAATSAAFEASDDNDITAVTTAKTADGLVASNQVGITYEIIDGLSVGYANASDALGSSKAAADKGIMKKTNAIGISYTMGDLNVLVGQQKDDDPEITVSYTMGALGISYKHLSDDAKNDDLDITYDMGNGVSIAFEYDQAEGLLNGADKPDASEMSLDITQVTGDLTFKVSTKHDESTDISVAYDMGNADLTVAYDDSNSESSIAYKVSF